MKLGIGIMLYIGLLSPAMYGQGRFNFFNYSAPTHLWTATGPLAGPDIWAQTLVGLSPDSLTPAGQSVGHSPGGFVQGGLVTVNNVPCFTFAFVQMVAWDGTLWGSSFGNVPVDQLGHTDVVEVFLTCDPGPTAPPAFTRSAIVPVPEPSIVMLTLSAGLMTLFQKRRL